MSKSSSYSVIVGEQSDYGTAAQLTYRPAPEHSGTRKVKIAFSILGNCDDFELGELKGKIEMFANQGFAAMFGGQQDQLFSMEIELENGPSGRLFVLNFDAKMIPDEEELIQMLITPLDKASVQQAQLRIFFNDVCNSAKDKWVGGGVTFDSTYNADEHMKELVKKFVPTPAFPLVLLNTIRLEFASVEELKTVWHAFPELEEVEAKYSMLVPLIRMLAMDEFESMGVTKERVLEYYQQPFGDLFDSIGSCVKTIDHAVVQYRGHELKLEFTEFNILDILPRSFARILDSIYL
jgi:hypothetical protein